MLRDLVKIKSIYMLPEDNLVQEVIIPSLAISKNCDCMAGFFGSGSLREMAPGLAEFLKRPEARMRLLVSPYLTVEDQRSIRQGLSKAPEIIAKRLEELYGSAEVDTSALVKHTLVCLAYLIAVHRIEIKIVIVRNGLFHPKVRIFSDGQDFIIAHGSSNLTVPGLTTNVEQVVISKSWASAHQEGIVQRLREEFEKTWSNRKRDYSLIYDLPTAFEKNIVRDYEPKSLPTVQDFWDAWEHDSRLGLVRTSDKRYSDSGRGSTGERSFEIPYDVEYERGDFSHQGRAVKAWEGAKRQGILAMATGSGKTIASLIAARRLFDKARPLLLVIAAPTLPLIMQWVDEVKEFGLEPVVPGWESNRRSKLARVQQSVRNLELGINEVECLVITHNLLCDSSFHGELDRYRGAAMLIGDEAHNLSVPSFLDSPPEMFKYRLGLSATPEKEYDVSKSDELKAYFGDVVFRFTLKEAIGKCLVPYEYYVHTVSLTPLEYDEWVELSVKLKSLGWQWKSDRDGKDAKLSSRTKGLLRKRRIILEQATSKVALLGEILRTHNPRSIRHTLVYVSDKKREQLNSVNRLLMDDLGLLIHQITYEENSGKTSLTSRLLDDFAGGGGIQVLTAMRVLDEGVDIPEVATAYILASTTVERQWIQRRGRILRKCSRTNKERAFIHDFLVIPPVGVEIVGGGDYVRRILQGELKRVMSFAATSINASRPNGAIAVIEPIMERYFL